MEHPAKCIAITLSAHDSILINERKCSINRSLVFPVQSACDECCNFNNNINLNNSRDLLLSDALFAYKQYISVLGDQSDMKNQKAMNDYEETLLLSNPTNRWKHIEHRYL